MRRREFITLIGGAAAWPFTAQAQQPARMRRVGVFVYFKEENLLLKSHVTAFQKQLVTLGWSGNNLQIDVRWTGGSPDLIRKFAAELVALNPDVILIAGGSLVGAMQQISRTVPIVFVEVADAVGAGFVESLSHPGGNATGFTNYEYNISGKWLELLKQIAPNLGRAAVLRDAGIPTGIAQLGVIQAVAPALNVEIIQVNLREAAEIEHAITAFASSANGGLIIAASGLAYIHRDRIIKLAAERRLPAIYFDRVFVAAGGLVSYGPDLIDQFRRAAGQRWGQSRPAHSQNGASRRRWSRQSGGMGYIRPRDPRGSGTSATPLFPGRDQPQGNE